MAHNPFGLASPVCPAGRKFPDNTVAEVQKVFLGTCALGGSAAEGGLGLLIGGACPLARQLGLLN